MKQETQLSAQAVEQDKFRLGRVTATAQTSAMINISEMLKALVRHGCGDWKEAERAFNERSLRESGPIISDHMTLSGVRFRLMTSADREATLIDVRSSMEWPLKHPIAKRLGRYKRGEGGIVCF